MYLGRRHRLGFALTALSSIGLIAALFAGLAFSGCGGSSGRKKRGGLAPGAIFINEIVANATANDLSSPSVLKDESGDAILDGSGDPVDWIEIYNVSSKTIRLDKVTLTNDAAQPTLFRLPRVKLAPASGVVLICDGRPELGAMHAPFTLDAAGETLRLFTKNGTTELDEVRYGNMQADVSVGRFPDGEVDVGVIYVATPDDFNLPIDTKLPRIDGDPVLGPVTPGSDEETPMSIPILEDDALRATTVSILEISNCDELDPDPTFTGEFVLNIFNEATEEVMEERRNYIDEPFQRQMQRLTLITLLPHFEPGTSLQLLLRFENVMGTVVEERCGVIVPPEPPILAFDPSAWVDPRCPEPTEPARITAFLNVAESTIAADPDITQNVSISLSYTAGDDPEQTVDTSGGLTVEAVDPCSVECYGLEPVDNAQVFRVSHEIGPQPQGTLVSFSFSAQDTLRDETALLAPGKDTARASFQYASGIIPPRVVFNEVLPFSSSVLEELYTENERNAPGFAPPNFAELYNSAEDTLDVGGMYLARSGAAECADGTDCADDRIRFVREFRVADGTRIPRKEFLAFLFVSDDQGNAAPDLSGTPLEGKTVLVENSVQLADCVGSIFLMSRDDDGNCPVTRFDWDNRDVGGEQCPQAEDTPFGSLPDGADEIFELDPPTPAESNCIYKGPEIVGDSSVDLGDGDCLDPEATSLVFDLRVRVAWREFDLDSDRLGIEMVEVLGNGQILGSSTEQTRVTDDPDTPLCQIAVDLRVTLNQIFPEPFESEEITYEIRVTDTRGGKGAGTVVAAEIVVGVCSDEGEFLRGDANFDTKRNVTDLVWIAQAMFNLISPTCRDAFDSNDDGTITTDDFFVLADFIFRRGPRLPDPFVIPGTDPTEDDFQCDLSADES